MVMQKKSRPLAWLIAAFAIFAGALWQQRAEHARPAAPSARATRTPAAPATPPPAAPPEVRQTLPASVPAAEREELEVTLALIRSGGPFPHKQDGSVFTNRERRLPQQPRGYYREYTVRTPAARNRAARRVVQGKNGETWYTRDHYRTFVRIDE